MTDLSENSSQQKRGENALKLPLDRICCIVELLFGAGDPVCDPRRERESVCRSGGHNARSGGLLPGHKAAGGSQYRTLSDHGLFMAAANISLIFGVASPGHGYN